MFAIKGDIIIEITQIPKTTGNLRDKLIFGITIYHLPAIFKFFSSGTTLFLPRICPDADVRNEFTLVNGMTRY